MEIGCVCCYLTLLFNRFTSRMSFFSLTQFLCCLTTENCCSYHNKHEKSCPEGSIKFAMWNSGSGSPIVGGFGSFEASEESLVLHFHAANGTVLYSSRDIPPRRFQ